MHPLRETIKISVEKERERERGQEAAMMAAARSFAIRDSAYATSSRVHPDLDIVLPYAFRFETFAFYSNRV